MSKPATASQQNKNMPESEFLTEAKMEEMKH
jgi:hypothetical protein